MAHYEMSIAPDEACDRWTQVPWTSIKRLQRRKVRAQALGSDAVTPVGWSCESRSMVGIVAA